MQIMRIDYAVAAATLLVAQTLKQAGVYKVRYRVERFKKMMVMRTCVCNQIQQPTFYARKD